MRRFLAFTGAVLVVSGVSAQQGRGFVKTVTATATAETGKFQFTVTGDNPCGAVFINLGDGSIGVTYAIYGLPYTVSREFEAVGTHRVTAKGMGNCDGEVSTTVTVNAVRPRPATPSPTPRPAQPVVTPSPTPPTQPSRTPALPPIRFAEMDTNGDREISRAEWRGTPHEFASYDLNHDNKLSGDEVRLETSPASGARTGAAGAGTRGRQNAIAVSATRDWTDTGLTVQAGDLVDISASGEISYASKRDSTASPTGRPGARATARAPMPDIEIGALVGRIGNGPIFYVGHAMTGHRAEAGGRLYLRVNDDVLTDNKGEFRAVITVRR